MLSPKKGGVAARRAVSHLPTASSLRPEVSIDASRIPQRVSRALHQAPTRKHGPLSSVALRNFQRARRKSEQRVPISRCRGRPAQLQLDSGRRGQELIGHRVDRSQTADTGSQLFFSLRVQLQIQTKKKLASSKHRAYNAEADERLKRSVS